MKIMHKAVMGIALAAAASLAVSACAGSTNNNGGTGGGSGGKGGSGGGGQVVYGSDEAPQNWQPDINAGNGVATAWGIIRVLPSPFQTHPDFTVQPDPEFNAEAPKITSQNPFTVQYHINPKANWSDGSPINADDFIYNWKVNNPNDKDYGASGALGAKGACQTIAANYNLITSVTGSDNGKTVTVKYSSPYPDWQNMFSSLLPAHIMKKSTPAATCKAFNTGYPATKPLPFSGGPWMISSVDNTQKTFTLTPNKNYWGAKPKLSKLIYKTIGSDSQTVAQDLQNNEVGVVYPQPQIDLIKLLKQNSQATTEVNFGLQFEHIDFNTENPYLKDKTVRQAIALAMDREELVKETVGQFDPRAKVLNNRMLVNNQPGYQDNAPPQYNKPDVAKAKQMLESDGYTYSGNKLMKDGKQVSMNIVTTSNNPLRKSTELVVQSQLAKLGIKITPIQRDANVYFGDYKTQGSLNAGDCDLCLYAWVSAPFLSSNYSIYHSVPKGKDGKPDRSQEQQNSGLGGDPEVDKLLDKAVKTVPLDEQEAIWNQIDKQLWKDMFTLPLYQKPTLLSFNKKIQGVADNATNAGPLWNSETWTLKQ